MRIYRIGFSLFGFLLLTVVPTMAQGPVSQFAIARHKPPFLPTQAPAIATRVPFPNVAPGSSPIVIIQPPPAGVMPVFGTLTPVLLPPQTFIPDQFALPSPGAPNQQIPSQVMDPVHILTPGQTIIPAPVTILPVTTSGIATQGQSYFGPAPLKSDSIPVVGTSREEVLRRFGRPSTTIVTSSGETLCFDSGLTVRLENGKVTGAR